MSHIRIERFGTGYGQNDRAEREERHRPVGDEEHYRVIGVERPQDIWVLNDLVEAVDDTQVEGERQLREQPDDDGYGKEARMCVYGIAHVLGERSGPIMGPGGLSSDRLDQVSAVCAPGVSVVEGGKPKNHKNEPQKRKRGADQCG